MTLYRNSEPLVASIWGESKAMKDLVYGCLLYNKYPEVLNFNIVMACLLDITVD